MRTTMMRGRILILATILIFSPNVWATPTPHSTALTQKKLCRSFGFRFAELRCRPENYPESCPHPKRWRIKCVYSCDVETRFESRCPNVSNSGISASISCRELLNARNIEYADPIDADFKEREYGSRVECEYSAKKLTSRIEEVCEDLTRNSEKRRMLRQAVCPFVSVEVEEPCPQISYDKIVPPAAPQVPAIGRRLPDFDSPVF
jgi:hypothetical protein